MAGGRRSPGTREAGTRWEGTRTPKSCSSARPPHWRRGFLESRPLTGGGASWSPAPSPGEWLPGVPPLAGGVASWSPAPVPGEGLPGALPLTAGGAS